MNMLKVLCATFLALVFTVSTATAATDPFEDAAAAVRWGKNAEVIELVGSGAFDINQQNSEGYTLLHFAADQNNVELAKFLLERGADPNILTSGGSSAADLAYGGALRVILDAGGKYVKNAPASASATTAGSSSSGASAKSKTSGTGKSGASKAGKSAKTEAPDSRRNVCNARHYSSSSLCSDSTCKMREYRKWQTCLKTGSYY